MKIKARNIGSIIGLSLLITTTAQAESYTWSDWTFNSATEATSETINSGKVVITTTGANTSLQRFEIRIDDAIMDPGIVQSVGTGHPGFTQWSTQIDFTALTSTNGLILGVGNFGHGTAEQPGYKITGMTTNGNDLQLSSLIEIGSFNHTWLNPAWQDQFNDDVRLNSSTGAFVVSTQAGGDDYNSDIFLMSLPNGVKQIKITSTDPTAGDTINIILATPAIPEPTSSALFLLGLFGLMVKQLSLHRRRI